MRGLIVAALCGLASMPALAQPFLFSGVVQGGLGYATNPFLAENENSGAAFASIGISPVLSRSTTRTNTMIGGSYYREEYLSGRFGDSESASAFVSHDAQLSERLRASGRVSYITSTNPLIGGTAVGIPVIGVPSVGGDVVGDGVVGGGVIGGGLGTGFDPILSDPLTIGQRTRTLTGDASLNWQPTARDSFGIGVNATRSTYSGFGIARDYNLYGGSLSYSRGIDARTQVGVQVVAQQVDSDGFPDTRSLQPALTLSRRLNANWQLSGNVGAVIQHVNGGGTSTSLGFGASLCGNYIRRSGCVTVDRRSSASGIGGLRRDLNIGLNAAYELTEHSRLRAYGSYTQSDSLRQTGLLSGGDIDVIQARLDYERDLTRRLSIGGGGRYQNRKFSGRPTADSFGASVTLSAKIGRL